MTFARVSASGRLEVDGAPWLPRGVNSYPLLQHVGAGRLDLVADIFAQARALGRPLIRTLAFMDSGDSPARTRDSAGNVREHGLVALDQLLFAAAEGGIRLLLILANHWPDFGGAAAVLKMVAPHERLPPHAFWRDPRALAAQLAYQRALATRVNHLNGVRYADDPTIFAWELANEARWESRLRRQRTRARALARWAKHMSDGLRADGVRQLIAWGGAGHLRQHGEDLRVIAAEGGVDLLTLHMYANQHAVGRPEAAIAWGIATLRERAEIARRAGMPLLLEEVNWRPAPGGDRDRERARVLRAWLELAHALGVGTLPWMIGERGRIDHDGYLIRPEDVATTTVVRDS